MPASPAGVWCELGTGRTEQVTRTGARRRWGDDPPPMSGCRVVNRLSRWTPIRIRLDVHMTESRYARSLIEPLLVRAAFSENFQIMSQRHVGSPLRTTLADSRFATRAGGYTVVYAAPDFTAAFVETIVTDRFAHRRTRKVALREIICPPPRRTDRHRQLVDLARGMGAAAGHDYSSSIVRGIDWAVDSWLCRA